MQCRVLDPVVSFYSIGFFFQYFGRNLHMLGKYSVSSALSILALKCLSVDVSHVVSFIK